MAWHGNSGIMWGGMCLSAHLAAISPGRQSGTIVQPVLPLKCSCSLQLRRAWQLECRHTEGKSSTALCNEEPAAFRARLRRHVAAAREWGLDAADVGALAARNVTLVACEPSVLAARFEVLAAFVTPHGSLPDDSPACIQFNSKRAIGKHLRDVLVRGHKDALHMSFVDLQELLVNYVRLGLFASKGAAREGCLRSPQLLRTTSWRVMVRKVAAVRAVGGSPDDELAAAKRTYSAERVLEAGMLREYSGCALAFVAMAAS
jgi:hypothetical protein